MSAEDSLERLAGSILDGSEVDWELAEEDSDANGGSGRVRALRDLERIVTLHRALQRELEDSETDTEEARTEHSEGGSPEPDPADPS